MKLKLAVAIIAGIFLINSAKAQVTKPAAISPAVKAAEEMLIASGGKEQFEKSVTMGMASMTANLPEDQRAKLNGVMTAFAAKYMNWETIKPDLCMIYAREFTEAELKQLTAFHKSPLGKKVQEKTPLILQTTMNLSQKVVAEHQTELQQMVAEAMK